MPTTPTDPMFSTRGIEAIATITELRSKTSELVDRAKGLTTGIMIQKNNEPYAVLISYDRYIELVERERQPKPAAHGATNGK